MSELPPGWEWATLDDLVCADGCFTDGDWVESKDQDPDGDVRLIQLADVGEGQFRDRSSRYLTSEAAERLRCSFLRPGDVLIARMPEPLGRACLYPGGTSKAVTVVDVCIFRPGEQGVDPRWLMWWINSPAMRERILDLQTGTTRKRISRRNLSMIALPVPPLAEQRRIVTALEGHLSVIDAGLSALRAAQRKAFLFATAARETVSCSDSHRPTVRLYKILREPLRNRCSGRATTNDSGTRIITLTAVTKNQFSDKNAKLYDVGNRDISDLWLEPGDILIQRANTPDLVGTAALYSGGLHWAIFPDLLIRIRVNGDILAEFLNASLSTRRMRQYFKSSAKGLAGTMPKIDQGTVERATLWLPSLDVQRRVVDRLCEIEQVVLKLNTNLKLAEHRAKRLRASLLVDAFSGRLVPQNPTDEPAEVLLARIRAKSAAQLRVKHVRRIAKNANHDQEGMP